MGTLYIVGTPIGNLEDITHRALRILREVAVIAAEDTRQTRKLLSHFDIHTPLVSYHEHNQRTAGPALIERLQAGEDVALVTDAGMPAISDPGEDLVRQAIAAGIPVVPVPGPTAFVTALVVSGLPTDRFCFEGFLPAKGKERRAALERLRTEPRTWILYEAPHRLLDTLADLAEHLGDRPMAAARELTKLHEEVLRGTPAELLAHFQAHPPRGEFVLVVSGAPAAAAVEPAPEATPVALAEAVAALEAGGMDRKAAMKEVATRFGLSKRDVYQAVLAAKGEG
jgi:16S rRNA (cytidine1402-2'-O)-methyltransferase